MMNKITICLCMIVRNESRVIRRCLASVRGIIDCWLIVDTGSTDGTQQIIQECLKEIPGELVERPWVDFAHNRTEAFRLARHKADFSLVIDADEELEFAATFAMPDCKEDVYLVNVCYGSNQFHRTLLLRNQKEWYWEGVVHESLHWPQGELRKSLLLKDVINRSHFDGGRNLDERQKFLDDAALLEQALRQEPENSRNLFYLGQSYMQAGEWQKAIEAYDRRARQGGWAEEVYYSLYMIGYCQDKMKLDPDLIAYNYSLAYQFRPSRAEPLARIAWLFLQHNRSTFAYIVAQHGATIPYPQEDHLFIEPQVYLYGLELIALNAAYLSGKNKEALAYGMKLLAKEGLPPELSQEIRDKMNILQRSI